MGMDLDFISFGSVLSVGDIVTLVLVIIALYRTRRR